MIWIHPQYYYSLHLRTPTEPKRKPLNASAEPSHETPLNLTPTKPNHNKAQPFGLLVELELSRIATPP